MKAHWKRIYLTAPLCLAIAGFAAGQQAAPTPAVEDLYLAKDDGHGKAGDEVKEFVDTDVPIWCIVLLGSTSKTTVKMNFIAVKVSGVRPDTKVVSATYTTKEGQNRVNFTGRPDGRWTPGRYRVDIFLDDKPARQVEFDIKTTSPDTAGGKGFRSPATSKPGSPKRPGTYIAQRP